MSYSEVITGFTHIHLDFLTVLGEGYQGFRKTAG